MSLYGEFQSVSVEEIKKLLLFDFSTYKFQDGTYIFTDEYFQSVLTLCEQEIYSLILQNGTKPATYKPEHVKLAIKKLAVARIRNDMIERNLLGEKAQITDIEKLLQELIKFLLGDRQKQQISDVSIIEESGYGWYQIW